MSTHNKQNEQNRTILGSHAPPGPAIFPPRNPLAGQTTALIPLQPAHAPALYRHLGGEENLWRWTYMPSEGYPTFPAFEAAVAAWSESRDPAYYVTEAKAEAAGLVAYMAVAPAFRRLEIGHVILGGPLTRSRQATEAFYLLLRHAFDELGYTRVEWKTNRLNEASRRAARRLGFLSEGVFRKHMIVKGMFRDTAWFGMTDDEWPTVKRGLRTWLDDSNFDEDGRQRRALGSCRDHVLDRQQHDVAPRPARGADGVV
ncbi:acyl-CoA N-acyltransferase [Chaetomidium leptoderma]|uniref:Acyl-CoA N-acyltransferase n=1 Tax=Chaetomidium leptoderma TaxID=669021 RepID=A0AAN6VEC2_9PEZI|nr:acyl-CoA N-acyltransferase [Chaetomidium leptoderma]